MTNLSKSKFLLGVMSVAIMFVGVFATTVSADCSITLTLRVGSRGVEVQCLQSKLGIIADGSFGPKTRAAVVAFQASHQLVADGIFGARSRTAWMGSSTVSANLPTISPSSSKFQIGDRFQTSRPVYALNTPGYTDGLPADVTSLGVIHPVGDMGVIMDGLVVLPAEGNNYTWRKVNFDTGTDGWVDESSLVKINSTTTTTTTITPTTQTPVISSLSSLSANTGDRVYVYGSNFDSTASIWIDNGYRGTSSQDGNWEQISATFISSTSVSFIVPSGFSTGTHAIKVDNIVNYRDTLSNAVDLNFTNMATTATPFGTLTTIDGNTCTVNNHCNLTLKWTTNSSKNVFYINGTRPTPMLGTQGGIISLVNLFSGSTPYEVFPVAGNYTFCMKGTNSAGIEVDMTPPACTTVTAQ